jgi:hypothetical protein
MNAGKVTVNSSGTIGAGGDNGAGINFQSIGGGGGTIVLHSDIVTLADPDYTDPQLPLAFFATLGGMDGDDNNGGDLESSHDGLILTDGTGTTGIRLQSIGAGGGLLLVDVTTEDPTEFGGINATLGATNCGHHCCRGSCRDAGQGDRGQAGRIAARRAVGVADPQPAVGTADADPRDAWRDGRDGQ